MSKVIFRMDANSSIGLGHLQRCLSLARALQLKGYEALFVMHTDEGANRRVREFGFGLQNLAEGIPLRQDQDQTLEFAEQEKADIAVVDSYEVDEEYLLALRESGFLVVSIDDLAQLNFPSHIVVNGNIYGPELPYRSLTGDTKFLLGTKYTLLREEFWEVPKREIRDEVRTVLVTLGGADRYNLTPMILEVLDGMGGDFSITVIVGPFFENRDEIRQMVERLSKPVTLLDAPQRVRDVMLGSDLAISGGGQTLYELAATGTPTVALCLADNQRRNVQKVEERGVGVCIEDVGKSTFKEDLAGAVGEFMGSYEKRASMSRVGQELVDGKGAWRMAGAIVAMGRRGGPLGG